AHPDRHDDEPGRTRSPHPPGRSPDDRAGGPLRSPCPDAAPLRRRGGLGPGRTAGPPGRRPRVHRPGPHSVGRAPGRGGGERVRRHGRVVARHGGAPTVPDADHGPAAQRAAGDPRYDGAAARPGHPGPPAGRRAVAARPAAHRARDRGPDPRRVGVPGPGAAEARRVPAGVPGLLPQPRHPRRGRDRAPAGRRGRPGRLGRGAPGDPPAARRRDHRLGARAAVRAVGDRHRVPVGPGRGGGGRLGVAHGRRPVPRRPAQGQRAGAGALGPAALHLARPHPAAGVRPGRDPRRPHRGGGCPRPV
ncbi:MAG: hypothetical protein AVDCRST_MAG66-1770, partial [uncultured Pseudonocardia sp.]